MKNKTLSIAALFVASLAVAACSKSNSGGGGGGGGNPMPYQQPGYQAAGDTFDNSYGNPQSSILGQRISNRSFYLNDKSGTSTGIQNRIAMFFDSNGILNAVADVDTRIFEGGRANLNGFSNGMNVPQNNQMGGIVHFKATNIPYDFRPETGRIYISAFAFSSAVAAANPAFQPMPGMPTQPVQPTVVQGKLGIRLGVVRESTRKIWFIKTRFTHFESVIEARTIDANTRRPVKFDNRTPIDPSSIAFDIGAQFDSRESLRMSVGQILPSGSMYSSAYTIQIPNNQQPVQPVMNQQMTRFDFFPNTVKGAVDYLDPVLDQRGIAQ